MLIATIIVCHQALVRIGKIEAIMIGDDPGKSGGIYASFVPLLLLVSIIVYDKVKLKKIQRISVMGVASYLLYVGLAVLLGATGLALEILEGLR